MNIESIFLGTSANDNTGDTLRAGGFKINDNFVELFTFGPSRHRQSLLIYKTSGSSPSFITSSGLNVNLIAPLVCTIGRGYEQRGERNSAVVITSDQLTAWTVPDNTTSYLYIDKTGLSATPTFGYSSLQPYKAQVSAANLSSVGQHWFNTLANQMYSYDGSAFNAVNRIFVGYVVTSSGSVTNVGYYTSNDETDYVDQQIQSLSATTATQFQLISSTTVQYTSAILASAEAYTDAALVSAKSYTDTALTSAKNYTDLQTAQILISANTYADNSAKKYALILG